MRQVAIHCISRLFSTHRAKDVNSRLMLSNSFEIYDMRDLIPQGSFTATYTDSRRQLGWL